MFSRGRRSPQVPIVLGATAWFLTACSPQAAQPPGIPGRLELYDVNAKFFRDGDRVEYIPVADHWSWDGLDASSFAYCAYLTPESVDRLEAAYEALDPEEDYPMPPEGAPGCEDYEDAPDDIKALDPALVYDPRNPNSPFPCHDACCHPRLRPITNEYVLLQINRDGVQWTGPDGDPVVAWDDTRSCTPTVTTL